MKLKDVEIVMFPANSGDCILINFIKENFRVLIDGGYNSTYDEYLKPYLRRICKEGARLNLVIATHIDRDHINGIKRLLAENGNANNPVIIPIDEVWFNGFCNMPIKKESKDVPLAFSEIGCLKNMAAENSENAESGSVDISFKDGNSLAELIVKNDYPWNSPFSKAVVGDDLSSVNYGEIHIRVLNPLMQDLNNLAQMWIAALRKKCKKIVINENHLFDRAFEGHYLYDSENVSYRENVSLKRNSNSGIDWSKEAALEDDLPDRTVQNLSSIALMFEYKGMTLLFPGDCPIHKIETELPEAITVVKLPHHGSGKSNSKEFIRNRKVKYYLVSTDGQHGHPSRKVIGNILCFAKDSPRIVTNYSLPMLEGISVMGDDVIDE